MARELADARAARAELEHEKEAAIEAKAATDEVYEHTKDLHTNFAYILSFAEAIQAHRCADSIRVNVP